MSNIVEVSSVVESDHALIFLKSEDGEIHALEYGQQHKEAEKHNHHDQTHAHIEKHSQGKSHAHEEKEEHAAHGAKHEAFGVHVWSPIGSRPGHTHAPSTWSKVSVKTYTAETLSHELKHEWHGASGVKAFADANTFVSHVLADKLKC